MDIDLEAVALDAAVIKDRRGKRWSVDPEMTAGEALLFMNQERMSKLSGVDVLNKLAEIVSRGLIRENPEMNPEQTLATFTPMELGYVVSRFLALTGASAALVRGSVAGSKSPTKTKSKQR